MENIRIGAQALPDKLLLVQPTGTTQQQKKSLIRQEKVLQEKGQQENGKGKKQRRKKIENPPRVHPALLTIVIGRCLCNTQVLPDSLGMAPPPQ